MDVNIIRGTTPQLMNAMLFHGASEQVQSWISEQYQQARSSLTDVGRSMLEAATAVSRRMTDPNLYAKARALLRRTDGELHPNTITPLLSVEALQQAKPIMQRYLMANRPIRELYHQQRVDGYSDSYVDHQPGLIGDDHYDYRRVMHGIIQDHVLEDGTVTWKASMYPEALEEGDRQLEIDEQAVILDAWLLAKQAMMAGLDPTNALGGKL